MLCSKFSPWFKHQNDSEQFELYVSDFSPRFCCHQDWTLGEVKALRGTNSDIDSGTDSEMRIASESIKNTESAESVFRLRRCNSLRIGFTGGETRSESVLESALELVPALNLYSIIISFICLPHRRRLIGAPISSFKPLHPNLLESQPKTRKK